jgi:hypothetical protein
MANVTYMNRSTPYINVSDIQNRKQSTGTSVMQSKVGGGGAGYSPGLVISAEDNYPDVR